MAVTLKCAACGAQVEFEELSPTVEATCPGCEVRVRYREGDEQMAIPVSMSLPEKFQHIDLKSVADKSSLLVGRYRKPTEEPQGKEPTEVTLARALETLANSIGHLEERLSRHERGGTSEAEERYGPPTKSGDLDPESVNGVKLVPERDPGHAGVVQLATEQEDEKEGKGESQGKANPVGARVLVRREAAREAHEFRREKHTQADWDDHARERDKVSGFGWLMMHFPRSTVAVSLVLVGCLIAMTILVMNDLFRAGIEGVEEVTAPGRGTALSQLMVDDPEAALSETVARGFLNSTSAKSAAPFVYEAEMIKEKFEAYYAPISSPSEYELTLTSRALSPGGQSIFAYRVAVPGEQPRMLVVLPEGKMPKVFWEFFAEVGETTWDEFLETRPKESVEMRVWVYPGNEYFSPYNQKDWQSYVLHDYGEKRKIFAFADRGASEDWHISDAIAKEPVQFKRHAAVMAHVSMTYMTKVPDSDGVKHIVVEIKDVLSTSWLPKRYQTPRNQR